MLKRNVLSFALASAVMATTFLTGCGPKVNKTSNDSSNSKAPTSVFGAVNPSSPVTITVGGMYSEKQDILKAAAEKFHNDYPNVTVDVKDYNEYDQRYQQQFQSGTAEDLVFINDGAQQKLEKYNYLADISAEIDKADWTKTLQAGSVEFNNQRTPGKNISVPVYTAGWNIYYNKNLFAKAGIAAPPKTWDEFESDLDKLKAANIIPMQSYNWSLMWFMYTQVMNSVPFSELKDWYYHNNTTPAVEEAFKDAVKTTQDYIDKGYFKKDSLGTNTSDSLPSTVWAKGNTAMILTGDWDLATIEAGAEAKGFKVGSFVLPAKNPNVNGGKTYGIKTTDGQFAINAKTDAAKKALCLEYLNYVLSPDIQIKFAEAGFTPALATPDFLNTLKNDNNISKLKEEQMSSVVDLPFCWNLDETLSGLGDVVTAQTDNLIVGKTNPDNFWKIMNEEYKKEIAQLNSK